MKVLIVDDNELMRTLLSAFLNKIALSHFEAENGIEAIEVLSREPGIKLVLTDFEMPGMNGLDLARRIDNNIRRIPVIFMSGNQIFLDKIKSTGFKCFAGSLMKPFVFEDLRKKIDRAIV